MTTGLIRFKTDVTSLALMLGVLPSAFAAEPKVETTKVFPIDGIETLDIRTGRGDILIKGTDRLTLKVELTKTEDMADCRVIAEPEAQTAASPNPAPKAFRLEVKDRSKSSKGKCFLGLSVEIPERMDVRAVSGTGDIEAAALAGDFSADGGAGEIRLKNLRGQVKVKTGAGSVTGEFSAESGADIHTGIGAVTLTGLKGPVSVETGTGEVSLEYDAVPVAESSATIKTGTASAVVFLPEGAKIRTKFKSGMGHLTNDLGETPDANFLLSMNSGTGSLIVNKIADAKK